MVILNFNTRPNLSDNYFANALWFVSTFILGLYILHKTQDGYQLPTIKKENNLSENRKERRNRISTCKDFVFIRIDNQYKASLYKINSED